MSSSSLSVVIGTFNRLDMLKRCLKSIRLTSPAGTKIHVTDAGSTDGTVDWLKEQSSGQIISHLIGKKLGQAKALNDVFELIDTPYVAWLSDDNVMVGGGLLPGLAILEQNPKFGMVGLKVKDVEGPFVDAPYIGGISSAGILNVNQGLIRTPVLREVGGFSEAFVDYGIDPDLTAKVLFAGQQIVFTREIVIHHYRGWAPKEDAAGQARLKEKHDRYYHLYDVRYRDLDGNDPAWRRKQRFWEENHQRLISSRMLCGIDSLLGMNARDWMNVLKGRYIKIWDGWYNLKNNYHLVQALHHSEGTLARTGLKNFHP